MEQATEAIKTLYLAVRGRGCGGRFDGPALPESLVWSSLVVVLELRPPAGDPPLGDRDAQVMVITRLGGLVREYSRAAA